jgi:BirA family biotin operon repressor/biotin-[acetyl-CoA-carboxylase] ligase
VAEEQSDGRGRQGRAWIAPRGESLLFSVLLRIDCDPRSLPPISVAAGLAVTEAVALHVVEPRPALKWPNDVLIGDRKVAGVLVEATATGPGSHDVVVGIGINVHTRVFPAELAARATSIANHVSRAPVRAELLADVLERLDRDLAIVVGRGLGPLASRLAACDGLGGKPVRCAEGLEGIAEGIDERGRLLVRGPDGALARWSSGEVHIVRRSAPSPCF